MPDVDIDDLSAAIIDGCTKHYNFYADDRDPDEWWVDLDLTDEERERDQFAPMMNSLWPLPEPRHFENRRPRDAKDRLENMTLVCVREDDGDNLYLALTGGGMDMSLSIARSYVALGYLPPATLGRVPRGVFSPDVPTDRRAVAALRKSLSLMRDRYARDMDELDALTDDD